MITLLGQEVRKLVEAEYAKALAGIEGRQGGWPQSPRDEALCNAQSALHSRGYRSAELVKSVFGWSVRSGSGLDGFALLASSRTGVLTGSAGDALKWAMNWVSDDPNKRDVFFRGLELPGDLYTALSILHINPNSEIIES